MAGWYASGAATGLVLLLMAAEAAVLVGLWAWRRRGVPPRSVLAGVGAGACLVAAAGVALQGGWWGWVGALLLGGGVLHGVDLAGRWQ